MDSATDARPTASAVDMRVPFYRRRALLLSLIAVPLSIVGHVAVWDVWEGSLPVTVVTLVAGIGLYRIGWGRSLDRRGALIALAVCTGATVAGLIATFVWFAAEYAAGIGGDAWALLASPRSAEILGSAMSDMNVWGTELEDQLTSLIVLLLVGVPLLTRTWSKRRVMPLGR